MNFLSSCSISSFSGLVDRRPCLHLAFEEKECCSFPPFKCPHDLCFVLFFYILVDAGTNLKHQSSKRHYHCTFLPVLDQHHAPLLLWIVWLLLSWRHRSHLHTPKGKNVDTRTFKAHSVADRQPTFRAAEKNTEMPLTPRSKKSPLIFQQVYLQIEFPVRCRALAAPFGRDMTILRDRLPQEQPI